ncbi:MAG: DNA-binding protein, partial [Polyangiaceae bacterium]|nr:DNA-binding protein [Polyangiaceae bacterium]
STAEIEQTAHRILEHVRKNPGQRAEVIKKSLNLKTNEWALPIARLLEKKQLRTKGEKRATTYTSA